MVFEFTAYASLECERREREERLRKAALLERLDASRARDGERTASPPERWLGLLLIRLGRVLQRWGSGRQTRAGWE